MQGMPRTVHGSPGSVPVVTVRSSDVSQTKPAVVSHEPATHVRPDMLAHIAPLGSGEPAAQFA
jgi:hypothetical protein